MHDIRAIRENSAAFDAALARRGLSPLSPAVLALDEARRAGILAAETAQATQNAASKEVGAAKARGDDAEFERLRALVAEKKAEVATMTAEAGAKDAELRAMLLGIPNSPLADVPEGPDETANVEIRPLALAVADSSNGFRPRLDNVSYASSNPRIIMLMADDVIGGNRYALSINDRTLPAPVAGVRTLDPMRIYVVNQASLDTWRKALGLSGLDWTHYGMAVVIYRDRTLTPVAGIRPTRTVPDGADPFLKPGSEVFFLSADRERVEVGATATTASGVALFPLVGNRSLDVSGTTGAGFEFVVVSAPPGGLFIETCDQI